MIKDRKKQFKYIEENSQDFIGHFTPLKAEEDGKKILIIGGTHGNEPAGVNAICNFFKMFQKNELTLKQGKVQFLLANPEAYLQNLRYIDYDLNRSFTKQILDNYEGKRVKLISKLLEKEKYNAILDLHSVSAGDIQITIYNKDDQRSKKLALAISPIDTHMSYHTEHIEGLLIEEGRKHGSKCVVIECGNHLGEHSTNVANYHIYQFLRYFDMINHSDTLKDDAKFLQHHKEVVFYDTIKSIRPNDGFKFSKDDFQTGVFIKKGELYATSKDEDYIAEEDCYIVMPSRKIRPHDYNVGFLCSKTVSNNLHNGPI